MKRILPLLLPILILAACSSGASTPAPSGSAGLAPRQVTSVEDAAARVIEAYPSLAGVAPKRCIELRVPRQQLRVAERDR